MHWPPYALATDELDANFWHLWVTVSGGRTATQADEVEGRALVQEGYAGACPNRVALVPSGDASQPPLQGCFTRAEPACWPRSTELSASACSTRVIGARRYFCFARSELASHVGALTPFALATGQVLLGQPLIDMTAPRSGSAAAMASFSVLAAAPFMGNTTDHVGACRSARVADRRWSNSLLNREPRRCHFLQARGRKVGLADARLHGAFGTGSEAAMV